ncbi:L-lactate transporter, partial [Pseudolycoriella hygida]
LNEGDVIYGQKCLKKVLSSQLVNIVALTVSSSGSTYVKHVNGVNNIAQIKPLFFRLPNRKMNSTANLYNSTSSMDINKSSMDIAEDPTDVQKKKPEKRKNFIVRALLWHYGNTKCNVSAEQFEREKFIFGKVKFHPIILMPAAVLIQFCCGSLYAWSVFNTPIDEVVTGDPKSGLAPVTFYIAVGMFGVSAASMGPWLERNGPKKSLMLSSSLFFLGNLLSSLAIHLKAIWLLYIGYGMIGGFGLGLGYISPVSPLQKWFPNKRGMAAGLAVCGFGAGSIAIGKVILPLISAVGLSLTFLGTQEVLAP